MLVGARARRPGGDPAPAVRAATSVAVPELGAVRVGKKNRVLTVVGKGSNFGSAAEIAKEIFG